MTGGGPNRGLLAAGALSVGLVVVGEAFAIPLLPALGALAALTVVGATALEGFLTGGGATASGDDGIPSGGSRNRRIGGPLAALLAAGGIAGVGIAADVRPLVLLGSLFGLAVAGGLATLGVLASADDGGDAGSDGRR